MTFENSEADVYDWVYFSKVAGLEFTDSNSTHWRFFLKYVLKNYLSYKEYFDKKVYGAEAF